MSLLFTFATSDPVGEPKFGLFVRNVYYMRLRFKFESSAANLRIYLCK